MSRQKPLAYHIERAIARHGNKYDYSNVPVDLKSKMVVDITCDCGNSFKQQWASHVSGRGCQKCAEDARNLAKQKTREQHLAIAIEQHGTRYNYDMVPIDVKDTTTIQIECTKCGKYFHQTMHNHKGGHGCNCNKRAAGLASKLTLTNLKELLDELYGSTITVDYQNLLHFGSFDKLDVTCMACNNHYYPAVNDMLRGNHNCPRCSKKGLSAQEAELLDFIIKLLPPDIEVISGSFKIIPPYQLDIYIPSLNIAIEYCGLYWHTEKFGKHRNYHKSKFDQCKKLDIKLLTIFSDEWQYNKQLIKDKISNMLGTSVARRLHARKCSVVDITTTEKKNFLDLYHIQGNCKSSKNFGLMYDGELVSVAAFKKNTDDYELIRFASSCNVAGAFTKLMKFSITSMDVSKIITFADLRWSNGDLYANSGWELDKILQPDYRYVIGNKSYHKANFRRASLQSRLGTLFDPNASEYENCTNNGIYRIWDCGKLKFVLRK